MTSTDVALILFASCNVMRIAAYVPQMLMLLRHPAAAASFSHSTWALFAMANASTALYAGWAIGDAVLCVIHAFSALCCGMLMALAAYRCRRPSRPNAPLFQESAPRANRGTTGCKRASFR